MCLNDAKKETMSKLEIHSFKYQGNMRDFLYVDIIENMQDVINNDESINFEEPP
jgi:hypothetical protein